MKYPNPGPANPPRPDSRTASAFTLIELLVVIAIIAILAAMLLPTLARARQRGQAVYCTNNLKQLMVAWHMYCHDNSETMPPNLHGGQAQGGAGHPVYGKGWVEGWLDWTARADNIEEKFLVNDAWARIGPYVARSVKVFKCPADNFLSTKQISLGWKARVRSLSSNIGCGMGNAETGPWDSLYKHYIKTSDFKFPGAAETWVFVDEHPDSINDAAFFNPHPTQIVDTPAAYHAGACGFAFADGHAEIHKWRGCLTQARVKTVVAIDGQYLNNAITGPVTDPDIRWLTFHGGTAKPY